MKNTKYEVRIGNRNYRGEINNIATIGTFTSEKWAEEFAQMVKKRYEEYEEEVVMIAHKEGWRTV